MKLLELLAAIGACITSLDDYSVSRAALIRHSLSLRDLPGGPWHGTIAQNVGKGAIKFKGVGTTQPAADCTEEKTSNGVVGMLRNSNPHAPFREFRLIDAAGNPPPPGTRAELAEATYDFYLTQTGEAVESLRTLLPQIERIHIPGADTQSLTRFRVALPQPPYIPVMEKRLMFPAVGKDSEGQSWERNLTVTAKQDGAPSEEWEAIIADERKLIDTVRFDLHRMVTLAQQVDWKATEAKGAAAGEEIEPSERSSHSADFTFVKWHGTEYTFALGVQSTAVKALWDEWEKSGLGLHQDTIRNAVDPERDNFRMDKAFRNHPAFGTMIQKIGDGKYKLAAPTRHEQETPAKAKTSDSGSL